MVYDVGIVGAGPAGTAAAILLAKAGLTVCLLDKISEKTHKIGESLPAATIRLLKRLDIASLSDLLSENDYSTCSGNLSAWGSDVWTLQSGIHNPEGGGWHINRVAFECALRRQALDLGVVYLDLAVGKVSKTASDDFKIHPEGGEPIQTRWIVDATGRDFAIARQFGVKRQQFDAQLALFTWLTAPKSTLDTMTRIKSVSEGWWYSACLPSGERVLSLHGLPEMIAPLKKNPDTFWTACNEAQILPFTVLPEYGQTGLYVRAASFGRSEKYGDIGWLAVGDAAISFDPLSSQGIFFALYSGIRAAEAILISVHQPENALKALASYTQTVQNVFNANRQARIHYYQSEYRFGQSAYWTNQR